MGENKTLTIILVAIVAAVTAGILGFTVSIRAGILGLFLIPAMVMAFREPRWGLWALIIYLPLSNTIALSILKTYKVVGNFIDFDASYPLYKLSKDAFYFPALLKICLDRKVVRNFLSKYIYLSISGLIFLIFCLITFFTGNLPRGLGGITTAVVGLKNIAGYIPLILCGYYLLRDREDLTKINRLFTIMILICCSLNIVQYILLLQNICPDNEVVNRLEMGVSLARREFYPDISQKATLKAACFVGGSVLYNPNLELLRLPGTFSDPWQWSWFLVSGSVLGFAQTFSDRSKLWRLMGGIAMLLVFLSTLVSGQRIPLLLVPLFYLVLLVATERRKKLLILKLPIVAFVSVLAVEKIPPIGERISNFIGRWLYSSPIDFVIVQMGWVLNYLKPFGNGLGNASSGARHFDGDGIRGLETYYAKLLYEVGFFGFIAFIALVTVICFLTFRAVRESRDRDLKLWGTCIWIFIVFISYNPYYYPLSVEPVSVYYWLLAGFLLKLPEIEGGMIREEADSLETIEKES